MVASLSLVVWNVQFRRAHGRAGQALREAIAACDPDIACITEAHPDFLDLPHRIAAAGDHGYAATDGRRKVLLWSRQPWEAVDLSGDPGMPAGRYVAGRTLTPLGPVLVHGICIPWAHAHFSTGRRDSGLWEEHLLYLAGLRRRLHGPPPGLPGIVAGDYNQAIPRQRAPAGVHAELLAAFPPWLRHVTTGEIPPLGHAIDHVSLSPELAVSHLRGLDNRTADGPRLSDHFGLHLTLVRAAPAA